MNSIRTINPLTWGFFTFFLDQPLELSWEAALLIAFAVLTTFGVSVVFPYIPVHGKEIGMPLALIGNLIVMYYLLQALSRVPLGQVSDTIGHHRPILLGAIIYFLAAVAFVLSDISWPLLFLGEICLGIANSITWVTIPSYITDLDGIMPLFTFSLGVGWLIGSPLGGLIKDNLGMVWVFRTLLIVSVLLIILGLAFYHRYSEEASFRAALGSFFKVEECCPGSVSPYPSLSSFVDSWQLMASNLEVLIAGLFSFLVFMTFGLGASILPLYFSQVGFSSFIIGLLVATRTATSTGIRLFSNRIQRRFGGSAALVVSTALVGLAMILISRTPNLKLVVAISAFWGLNAGIYLPIVFKMIGDNTSQESRGLAMGIRGTMGTMGAAFGTWFFSLLAGQLTLASSLLIAGSSTIVGAFLLGWLYRHRRRRDVAG